MLYVVWSVSKLKTPPSPKNALGFRIDKANQSKAIDSLHVAHA